MDTQEEFTYWLELLKLCDKKSKKLQLSMVFPWPMAPLQSYNELPTLHA